MTTVDVERLRQIKTLPSLVKFLRDELDWPVEADEIDDLTFDYTTEELGLDPTHAVNVKEIKQLRPLDSKQPWGIFWINFEKKRLPMVVLRRILGNLIIKSRAGARKADRPSWHLHDLLFISSYGEEEHRNVSFAHFTEDPSTDELPVLRVLGWDDQNSIMHLDRVANRLHSHFRWPDDPQNVEAWRQCWSEAFTDRYREAIRSADELIPRLANLAAGVRRRVRDVLDAETERGPMRRLFAAVQKLLIHDMNEDGFADIYAQTVAYGLLSAHFSRPTGLPAQNLLQLTAVSNPFLENLLEYFFRLNRGRFHFDVDEVGINDVLDLLRNTKIEAIKAAFSDKNPAEDPVIRFYEGFLKQYDPQQRIKRGVFFTPRPVVSYIVRSVHELLQTDFGLEDGLASTATWADMKKRLPDLTIPKGASPGDPFICILDPAVGTGTFLFECIEVIERTMKDKWCRELGKEKWHDPEILRRWRDYVPKHLLPRLYGYELMMAPYSIAHLKLALKLGETGYQFREGDRLHIYLTNSLEPPVDFSDEFEQVAPALAHEARAVNGIKRQKRFSVVIGNPPYSDSEYEGEWILHLVEEYKTGLNEKKVDIRREEWKFLRYAQWQIETTGIGIVAHIINNSFLDSVTLRGIRKSLTETFKQISVLDLHGSVKQKDYDENVFEIQQGVAICVLLRGLGEKCRASVYHSELRGTRESKYDELFKRKLANTKWSDLKPDDTYCFFVPKDWSHKSVYDSFFSIKSIYPTSGNGVGIDRYELLQDYSREALRDRMKTFFGEKALSPEFRTRYRVEDSSSYKLLERRKQASFDEGNIRPWCFRPFDIRWVYYAPGFTSRPAFDVMQHLIEHENLALVAARQFGSRRHFIVFVCKGLIEISSQPYAHYTVFPLYLYRREAQTGQLELPKATHEERTANMTLESVDFFRRSLGLAYVADGRGNLNETFGPEDIFSYIYAVLHSPGYRSSYEAFLKIDYPCLPLTANLELFRVLALHGGELVALHLLESPKLDKPITKWRGATPSSEIEKVAYADATVWIDKAKSEGFRGVPENVWNFHIGGYQVCEKWLKDRKGRQLSQDDIAHYQKIVVALAETIRLMAEIDNVIESHGGWPGAFVTDRAVPKASKSSSPRTERSATSEER